MGEFDLIRSFFAPVATATVASQVACVRLGMGDDAALLRPQMGCDWVVSSDMLVAGRHFFHDVHPVTLGHKALAVNLSDLAAMGATPRAFTLALALPQVDTAWLAVFAQGLQTLALQHGIALVGGDTTRGPLTINITVMGDVPYGQALLRSGAQVGDGVFVSGCLGLARLGLLARQGEKGVERLNASIKEAAITQLERPMPRVALGQALRGVASSAMDVSDGVLGDIMHLLQASQVGAVLQTAALRQPLEDLLTEHGVTIDSQTSGVLQEALTGGDDYELLFTATPNQTQRLRQIAGDLQLPLTRVGTVVSQPPNPADRLLLEDELGQKSRPKTAGFDHFRING